MTLRNVSQTVAAIVFFLVGPLAAQSVALFDGFEEQYVANSRSVPALPASQLIDVGLGEPGVNDWVRVLPFSYEQKLIFPGATDAMPDFFGGFRAEQDGSDKCAHLIGLVEAVDRQMFRFQSAGPEDKLRNLYGLILRKTEDLSVRLGQLRFDTAVGWGPAFAAGENEIAVHVIARVDGVYYISSEHTLDPLKPFEFDAAESGWQAWDFEARGGDNFQVDFTDLKLGSELPGRVEALGIYIRGIALSSKNLSRNIDRFAYTIVR